LSTCIPHPTVQLCRRLHVHGCLPHILPCQPPLAMLTTYRRAGFPRGHAFNPCGHATSAAGGRQGQADPAPNAPHKPAATTSRSAAGSKDRPTGADSTRVARDLVADAFCGSLDGSPGPSRRRRQQNQQQQQHRSTGDGPHAKGGGAGVGVPRRTGSWSWSGSGSTQAALGGAGSESSLRLGARKLPKRLRRAVPLFEEMVGRAHRCKFGRLLEAHCPQPASVRRKKERTAPRMERDNLPQADGPGTVRYGGRGGKVVRDDRLYGRPPLRTQFSSLSSYCMRMIRRRRTPIQECR